MSNRANRSASNRQLFIGGILVIAAAISVGAYLGWRMNASSVVGPSPRPVLQDQSFSAQMLRRDVPFTVTLYYPVNGLLSTGSAAVKRQPDTQTQARDALAALLADQRASLVSVLKDVRLQELYLDASGTAYVDLVPNSQKEITASVGEEILALYAMVDTLTLNFEEIKQVLFLLDGKEVRTLAGHVDLSVKFAKRTDLIRQ